MTCGYSLGDFQKYLANDRSLALLSSHDQDTLTPDGARSSKHALIPVFMLEELHNSIVAFIIADDQVLIFLSHVAC